MLESVSIKGKLIACFAIMLALIGGLAALSYHQIETINHVATDLRALRLPATQTLGGIQTMTLRIRVNGNRLLLAKTPQQRADAMTSIDQRMAELQGYKARYTSLMETEAKRALFRTFEQQWAAYLNEQAETFAKADAGDAAGAQEQYNTTMSDSIRGIVATLKSLADLENAAAESSGAQAQAAYDQARQQMMLFLAVAAILAIGAVVMLVLEISRPLGRMTAAMHQLASGDTETAIPAFGRRDEVGAMAGAVQIFKESMIRARSLEQETAQARLAAEEQRKLGMREMADSFEAAIGGIIGQVSASASELQATAQTMTVTATRTASRSTTVAAAPRRRRSTSTPWRPQPRNSAPRSRRSAGRSTARRSSPGWRCRRPTRPARWSRS